MSARKQYPLRIAPEVWEAVERWAADDMWSANAQVEYLLRDELRRAGREPSPPARPARDERGETGENGAGRPRR